MDAKTIIAVHAYVITLVVAFASRPSVRRKLGLFMMPTGLTLTAAMDYIIRVGGFPANWTLTCGFWLVVGITGLVLVMGNPRGKEERKPEKWTPRRVLRLLSSVKLAISLLAIIAVILIEATVMRNQAQARRYIYHSWWFISLLALLCLNLILCTAGRWSFKVRRLGTTLTHAGVLIMVIGVVAGTVGGERGLLQLYIGHSDKTYYDGEERVPLPFTVYLQDFKVERYRDRGVREQLVVQVVDRETVQGVPLQVGKTFEVAGTPYRVTTVRYEPDFVVLGEGRYGSRSSDPNNPAVQVNVEGVGEEGARWVFANFLGMHQDANSNVRLYYQRIERIKAFKSKVELYEGGRLVASKTIEVNKPMKYRGYSIYQSSYDRDHEQFSVFEIARDPGVPFVYLGFLIISAGVIFSFYIRPLLLRPGRMFTAAGNTPE